METRNGLKAKDLIEGDLIKVGEVFMRYVDKRRYETGDGPVWAVWVSGSSYPLAITWGTSLEVAR